jgi:hypothetical protein
MDVESKTKVAESEPEEIPQCESKLECAVSIVKEKFRERFRLTTTKPSHHLFHGAMLSFLFVYVSHVLYMQTVIVGSRGLGFVRERF